MEELKRSERKKEKNKLKSYNVILVFGLVYTLITILAVISYISTMANISTTAITFGNVMSAVWWQILMIALFATCYIMYKNKMLLGILIEIIMSMAMLVYIVISVATMGIDLLALMVELIYPLILASHGLIELKKLNKKAKLKRKRIMSTV